MKLFLVFSLLCLTYQRKPILFVSTKEQNKLLIVHIKQFCKEKDTNLLPLKTDDLSLITTFYDDEIVL